MTFNKAALLQTALSKEVSMAPRSLTSEEYSRSRNDRGPSLKNKIVNSEKRGDQYRAEHQGKDVRVTSPQKPSDNPRGKAKGK
jgi:hypothetical protein